MGKMENLMEDHVCILPGGDSFASESATAQAKSTNESSADMGSASASASGSGSLDQLFHVDEFGATCFSASEAVAASEYLAKSKFIAAIQSRIASTKFSMPQRKSSEDVNFCNESVYGQCNFVEATGVVRLLDDDEHNCSELEEESDEEEEDDDDDDEFGGAYNEYGYGSD